MSVVGAHAWLAAFVADEKGATALEYALIASGIAIVALAAMTLFASSVVGMWTTVATHM